MPVQHVQKYTDVLAYMYTGVRSNKKLLKTESVIEGSNFLMLYFAVRMFLKGQHSKTFKMFKHSPRTRKKYRLDHRILCVYVGEGITER